MAQPSKEFFFPPPNKLEDLEALEKMGTEKYCVTSVSDIEDISPVDQLADLNGVFDGINKTPLNIVQSENFDMLYSFVKKLNTPGVVSKEARQVIADGLAVNLRKLVKALCKYMASSAQHDPETVENLRKKGRSACKMYAFVLSHVLTSIAVEKQGGNDELVVTTQAVKKRKRGAGGGGGAAAGGNPADAADYNGVEIASREIAVAGFTDLLSPELKSIWVDGVLEEIVISTLMRTSINMLSHKSNTDGDDNPVSEGLRTLIGHLTMKYTINWMKAEERKAAEGTPNTSVSPQDMIVTPLIELLMRSPSVSKFCSKLLIFIDSQETPDFPWAHSFIGMVLEAVANAAIHEVGGDSASAKNVALFIEEQAHNHATAVHRFSHCFLPTLCSESYEVRKGAMTALSELILQKVKSDSNEQDEELRDRYLQDLWMRMRDINNFARTHCIKLWRTLVERKAVPKRYYLNVVEEAVLRLQDKYIYARRAAMQLLQACMNRNWFGQHLSFTLHSMKYEENLKRTAERFAQSGGSIGGQTLDEAVNAARGLYTPNEVKTSDAAARAASAEGVNDASLSQGSPNNKSSQRQLDEDDEILSSPSQRAKIKVEPGISPSNRLSGAVNDIANEGIGNGGGGNNQDLNNSSALNSTRSSGNISTATGAPEIAVDPDVAKIIFFDAAVRFCKHVGTAMKHAVELLDSKSPQDATEAMEFIVACHDHLVDDAAEAVLKILVMIFIHDTAIQKTVCDLFAYMFFRSLTKEQAIAAGQANMSAMARNLVRVHKLLGVLAHANAGEASAIERIIAMIRARTGNSSFISNQFIDAVFGVADGTLDDGKGTAVERRLAMRLYTMLAAAIPSDVGTRRESIIELIEANNTDNVLISHAFAALQKECLNKAFVPFHDPTPEQLEHNDSGEPQDHPVIHVILQHLCKHTSQLGTWAQLADTAIAAIHLLHATPVTVYQRIVSHLAYTYQQNQADYSTLAQLFIILGHTAIKHLVSIDCYERAQMRKIDNPLAGAAAAAGGETDGVDVMHKELGMGGNEFARHELLESCAKAKTQMLDDKSSIWAKVAPLVVKICKRPLGGNGGDNEFRACPVLRTSAVLALTRLMITNEDFCNKNLNLLFGILKGTKEIWEVKTNVVIALGDLCCVHPNTLQPWMKSSSSGFYGLLSDRDRRVRATTVQVCTHLVLNDMLRVHEHLHTIVKLVADPDEQIATNAIMFVKHLAIKCKQNIGNLIPPLIPQLQKMERPKFEMAMRTLLEKVDKDKSTESLIEKLCSRYTPFSEDATPREMAVRLSFCLSELNYSSERAMKKIMSESCYNTYKQWLRDGEVLEYYQKISTKARPKGAFGHTVTAETAERTAAAGGAVARRDLVAIDEWEQRLLNDAAIVEIVYNEKKKNKRNEGEEGSDSDGEGMGSLLTGRPSNTQQPVDNGYRLLDPTSSDDDDGNDNDAQKQQEEPTEPLSTVQMIKEEKARRSFDLRRMELEASQVEADQEGFGSNGAFGAGEEAASSSEDEAPKKKRGRGVVPSVKSEAKKLTAKKPASKKAAPSPKGKKASAAKDNKRNTNGKRPRVKKEEEDDVEDSAASSSDDEDSAGSSSSDDDSSSEDSSSSSEEEESDEDDRRKKNKKKPSPKRKKSAASRR